MKAKRTTGFKASSSLLPREERKKIYEMCYWIKPDTETIFLGEILNESASGILLQTQDSVPEIGERICVLGATASRILYETPTYEQMIEYPLSRWGIVKRIDPPKKVGVQFEESIKGQSEYKRWYRAEMTVTTLVIEDRAILSIYGAVSLESGAFLQSLVQQYAKKTAELMISCHGVTRFPPTAVKVLCSCLSQFSSQEKVITLVTGGQESPSYGLRTGSQIPIGSCVTVDEAFNLTKVQPRKTKETDLEPPIESPPLNQDSNETAPSKSFAIMAVARHRSDQVRLSNPLKQINRSFQTGANLLSLFESIVKNKPSHLIIDVDYEDCGALVCLNKLRKHGVTTNPKLLILSPPSIIPLIHAALPDFETNFMKKPCEGEEYNQSLLTWLKMTETENTNENEAKT